MKKAILVKLNEKKNAQIELDIAQLERRRNSNHS